jgi:hypothetical protein
LTSLQRAVFATLRQANGSKKAADRRACDEQGKQHDAGCHVEHELPLREACREAEDHDQRKSPAHPSTPEDDGLIAPIDPLGARASVEDAGEPIDDEEAGGTLGVTGDGVYPAGRS